MVPLKWTQSQIHAGKSKTFYIFFLKLAGVLYFQLLWLYLVEGCKFRGMEMQTQERAETSWVT